MRDYFSVNSSIRFSFPIDGDCLNAADGVLDGDILTVPVTVAAPYDAEILVNGICASREGEGLYRADIPVTGYRSTLVAENRTDGTETRITVFRLPRHGKKHYRLSSDDNIRFLMELNAGDYRSIFDHPYLAVYKKAHDRYGAQVHLNLFYAFDETARGCFSKPHPYFDLSMMTDRYKEEFRANADWLKLAFHSRSEFPDAPRLFGLRARNASRIRPRCISGKRTFPVCVRSVRSASAP